MLAQLGSDTRSPESGQAAIESAITLPLFVFLILGILQLSLMHQARLLTKYAAYKAVRAGALHNASMQKMERAALAVLLPLVSRDMGGGEHIKPTHAASDFQAKWRWAQVLGNRMEEADLPYVQVTVCGPLRGNFPGNPREVNFDAPAYATSEDWEQGQRTKLRLQVTFNYRMPIPFANWIIFNAARNREVPWLMRLGKAQGRKRSSPDARGGDLYLALAEKGVYAHPIRATYTMRMQSNFLLQKPGHELPERNQCIFPFRYD
ncbi:MAG: pilus assembly protein [Myxococcaceae bacterium]|nr:pilus assembly protein [Myxococcaceae bacterium]